MQEMVNIFIFGKKYSVPGDLTIMTAMEYAGYQLKRGCGCRHGFCGACATLYRIKGDRSKQGYIDDVIGLISPVVAELATMFRRIERGEVDLFGDKKE